MWEMKVVLLLLTMEVIDVGCNTLSKAAMANGMSSFIYVTYTHGIALFFLIPFAFLIYRKTPVPPIGISMIFRLFLLGVFSFCCSAFLFIGIRYSSPTLASALNNLSPAFTFTLAIIFRMEILNLRAYSSVLKLIGTLVSISGAFIVIFYHGLPITLFPSSPTKYSLHQLLPESDQPNWALGGFFLATSSIFLSLCYIVKTWVTRDLHSEVLITIISFFFETTAGALVTLIAEKDNPSVWLPSVGIQLTTILIGAVEIGVLNVVQTWACGKKGPLFVAMFKPLQMIIAVVMGISFLKDTLYLGSVIGGSIIALGFYTVMKGKAEEEMPKQVDDESSRVIFSSSEISCDNNVPLLQNKNMEV